MKPPTGIEIVLALVLMFSLSLFSTSTAAAMVFRGQNHDGSPVSLRLLITPCGAKVKAHLEKIRPEFHSKMKAAVLTWRGKDWESCWMELGGAVYSIDEEGSFFQPIPWSMFRDDAI